MEITLALFKILKGESSRISTEITPFHEGYAYFTPDDGGLYIDSSDNGVNKRIRVTSPGAGGAGSTAVYSTLFASGWVNSEQTISVAGLTENTNGVIGISHDITDEQLEACGNAGLYVCGQGNGYLTIALNGNTPPCDIPVVVILLG